MLDPGREDTAKTDTLQQSCGQVFGSHGKIQKIAQDGSKSTYMIILSKDFINSETSTCKATISSSDFDSPSEHVPSNRSRKLKDPPEEVKLNLSNINDEDYDSNQSASSVFLKQDSGVFEQDNEVEDTSNVLGNTVTSDKTMSEYVICSRGSFQQQKKARALEQHTFPLGQSAQNVFASSGSCNDNKTANNSTARKIVFVAPKPADSGLDKIPITYTNEAVPVIGHHKITPHHAPATILPKTNSKAVPTFNISPINQHISKPQCSKFVPITPAESPANGASTSGPYTSTPVSIEPKSRQHSRQETTTHRPVYIIPSPFARQNTPIAPSSQNSTLAREAQYAAQVITPKSSNPSLNNSSGFISGSSSIETPDVSKSFNNAGSGSFSSLEGYQELPTSNSKGKAFGNGKGAWAEVYCNPKGKVVQVSDGSGGVVISMEDEAGESDLGLGTDSLSAESLTSSQESAGASDKGAVLNRSLTNIQWLKGMQLKDEQQQQQQQQQQQLTTQYQHLQWTSMTPDEIAKICDEYRDNKRPPFSYMVLIQMALCSAPDRRMMLKEICSWIEQTFPYYRHTGKRGWRNSIRHNLSLYNIFEREPEKRHGSYWTIKSDVEPKTKMYKSKQSAADSSDVHRSTPTLPSQIPLIPLHSARGQLSAVTSQAFHQSLQMPQRKKGPPPILPRPSNYTAPQAYALIPLSSVNQQMNMTSPGQQQLLFSLPGSQQNSACPSPVISEVSAAVASIQVSSASPIPPEIYCDPTNLHKEHIYTKKPNVVKQAWLDCQNMETGSSIDSDVGHTDNVTSSSEVVSSSEFISNRAKAKRPRVKPGLPKPTIYAAETDDKRKKQASKRRKLLQHKEKVVSAVSSDEEEDEGVKFISNLEREILAEPISSMETEAMEEMLTTSTPGQNKHISRTDMPSPIHALTPLRGAGGLFDESFLDSLTVEHKGLTLSPDLVLIKKSTTKDAGGFDDSLLDFNVLPFTSPDKLQGSPNHVNLSNQNLSRFLNDYDIETACDNNEQFPNLNWSVVQQMVDNMDTS